MLVPTVFQPATFSCSDGCSVPHSPWSTHLSPCNPSLGKMAVNSQHHRACFGGSPSFGMRWVPWECGHPLFPQFAPSMLQKVGHSPPMVARRLYSLEIRLDTGQSGYSALDLWQHLSEAAMAHCQPSASGRRMMTK